jgi:PHD/YefM family antitoxin component YafN of YafNO toxin-antitoxin module
MTRQEVTGLTKSVKSNTIETATGTRFRRHEDMSSLKEQYIVDRKGGKTAVILPFKRYEQLLEDLHDLAVVAERRKETPISLEEMRHRLKRNGLL